MLGKIGEKLGNAAKDSGRQAGYRAGYARRNAQYKASRKLERKLGDKVKGAMESYSDDDEWDEENWDQGLGGSEPVRRHGVITKSGGKTKHKKWNLRYLRMDKDNLRYYKTMKSSKYQGTIPVEIIEQVRPTTHMEARQMGKGAFDVVTEVRTYIFMAKDSETSEGWMRSIEHNMSFKNRRQMTEREKVDSLAEEVDEDYEQIPVGATPSTTTTTTTTATATAAVASNSGGSTPLPAYPGAPANSGTGVQPGGPVGAS